MNIGGIRIYKFPLVRYIKDKTTTTISVVVDDRKWYRAHKLYVNTGTHTVKTMYILYFLLYGK